MRWPVEIPRATPHGKWGFVRRSKADGSCGVSAYPCTHPGLDLAGSAGTPVVAPEPLSVDAISTGALPPFRGYGPGVMLARGKTTGVYHLFGHLDPDTIQSPTEPGTWWDWATTPLWKSTDQRNQIAEGEVIGRMSSANHVHWETRTGPHGARNNPALWVKRYVTPSLDLSEWSVVGSGGNDALLILLGLWLLTQ